MTSKTVRMIGRLKNDNREERLIASIEHNDRHSVDVVNESMADALYDFTTLPGNWIRIEHAIYDLSEYDRVRFEVIVNE